MIATVGIIGAGTMGFGIAFQLVTNKVNVILNDISEKSLADIHNKMTTYLNIFREEGALTSITDEEVFAALTLTTKIEDVSVCDLVIETASENLEIKQKIFQQLDTICDDKTILSSNTSSLKLSDIMRDVTKHRGNILLTHFFNPAHIVPLVELLKSPETKIEVFDEVRQFLEKIGKTTIEIRKEVPGLVANRIQTALAREALSLLEDGVVSEEDLERAVFAGPGFRYATSGVLKIMDFGGLDIWNIVLGQLQGQIESGVREYEVLSEKVAKKEYGVKTSKGFFEYPGKNLDGFVIERDRQLVQQLQIFNKINGGS